MDEYATLAQRVALTLDDVRGCLVLSRDGLVLGAFPEAEESVVKQAWLRFAHLGEPRRSFVEYGDQIWAYVHRGPYASFIVSGAAARPGVLLDQLEQALLTAEEERSRRGTLKVPDASAAPSGKPRTTLHPPADRGQTVAVGATPSIDPAAEAAGSPPVAVPGVPTVLPPIEPVSAATDAPPLEAAPAASAPPAFEAPQPEVPPLEAGPTEAPQVPTALKREPQKLVSSGWVTGEDATPEGENDPAEIDRVLLAKEFSGLLQLDDGGDEGSS